MNQRTFFVLLLYVSVISATGTLQAQTVKAARTCTLEISGNGEISRFEVLAYGSEKIHPRINHIYHWYLGGTIHASNGGIGGKLLHGKFRSYYNGFALHESGCFRNGQKTGEWITWYSNGTVNNRSQWDHGLLHGRCVSYNEDLSECTETHYRNGQKQGMQRIIRQGECIKKTKYRRGSELAGSADKKGKWKPLKWIQDLFKRKKKTANE